jgi:molybdate transport system permease protein
MERDDLDALLLTLEVAGLTTFILILIALPLGWALARSRSRWRVVWESCIALPLVLPPTVIGFYLLLLMSPQGGVSAFLKSLGWDGQLSFSFSGLVLGSMFYSLPFAVQPLQAAFERVPQNLLDAAATLRASAGSIFFRVVFPLSLRGFFTSILMTFAHTVGEFGVVLMVGGNIPGKTRMVSIAIFEHVEQMEYSQAHFLSAVMVGFAFFVLTAVYFLNRRLESVDSVRRRT